jgi:hypothetical protein
MALKLIGDESPQTDSLLYEMRIDQKGEDVLHRSTKTQ